MIEAAVTLAIAAATGLGVVSSRLNERINSIELRVAEKYIPREEVSLILTRFEDHMVRIEEKLDNLISKDK
jgi:uncharacterized coiled-coil protein SlyX|tara:strand:- start:4768 stop:4980 length:213 start_codon:yes stop_codon:yes gene_type:complete